MQALFPVQPIRIDIVDEKRKAEVCGALAYEGQKAPGGIQSEVLMFVFKYKWDFSAFNAHFDSVSECFSAGK